MTWCTFEVVVYSVRQKKYTGFMQVFTVLSDFRCGTHDFSPFISVSGNPLLQIRPYTLRVRYAERRLITANNVRVRMRSIDV
jgi:hypothetical protein